METLHSIMDAITHFIFNWTTYFWSIPLWIILWGLFLKYVAREKITVGDLPILLIVSLMNPIWYLMVGIMVLMIPFMFLILWFDDKYWSKIKNIEIL